MDKKILMLSMSCNDPYYQALLGAVRNTWAKPLLHNKYQNITWFAYTACDEKHPKPIVDFKNHMIYVDTGDGLYDTYEKTQRAYEMIKDVVDFNYVIRTNTSIFINIENMLKRLDEVDYNCVWGRCVNSGLFEPHSFDIKEEFWLLHGFFFGMNRYLFEIGMSSNRKHIEMFSGRQNIRYLDDDIISLMLHFALGDDFPTMAIEPDLGDYIVNFRTSHKQDYLDAFHIVVVDNPEVIKDRVIVRLRDFWTDTKERGSFARELQNFYELQETLNKKEDVQTQC